MNRKTLVQIYEIQTPEEAALMTALGVDHVGAVLVSTEKARDPVIRETVAAVRRLGVVSSVIPLFSDFPAVSEALETLRPDIIHFCDDLVDRAGRSLDPAPFLALQQNVRERFPKVQIMRSIPIALPGQARRVDTLGIAAAFAPLSDWFLTDTWLGGSEGEPVSGFIGITGKTCDWPTAAALVKASPVPVILAGGLGPENASAGISAVRPAGIDSCTRTNARDESGRPIRFKKDPARVAAFVAEAGRIG